LFIPVSFNNGIYPNQAPVYPTVHPFRHQVLQLSSGIEDLGGIRWELLGFLAAAWLFVFLCLIRGIKSSGKVRVSVIGPLGQLLAKQELAILNTETIDEPKKNVAYDKQSIQPNLQITAVLKLYHFKSWKKHAALM